MMSKPRDLAPRQPAAETIQACVTASLAALRQALMIPEKLENRGRVDQSTDPFRNRQILAKVECEAAVIGTFCSYKLPVRLVSREHGTKNLHETPQLLLVLNGLDGSASFVGKGPSGSHGTLFSVFSSLEPSYRDYVCAGMADFKSGRLYLAVRGQGLEMYEGTRGSSIHLPSGTFAVGKGRGSESTLCGGGSYEVYGPRLKALEPASFCSSLDSMRRMFEGKCHGIVESTCKTRQGNIGQAALYALVREAGGVVISLDGEDLGAKDFLSFGQLAAKGIIAARSPEVAETLRQKLVA